jgi:hypothetical protein
MVQWWLESHGRSRDILRCPRYSLGQLRRGTMMAREPWEKQGDPKFSQVHLGTTRRWYNGGHGRSREILTCPRYSLEQLRRGTMVAREPWEK